MVLVFLSNLHNLERVRPAVTPVTALFNMLARRDNLESRQPGNRTKIASPLIVVQDKLLKYAPCNEKRLRVHFQHS